MSDALRELFEPAAVAFIGASSDPYKLGGRPIRFMKQFGYSGPIYPVHPSADEVQGLRAYRSIEEIPGPVSHAVIVVPASACEAALRSCARKRVRVVQIFSSGFAELGESGARMQQVLLDIARQNNMRLLGPNCLGTVSPAHRLFASFSTALEALRPEPGSIGLATQSGAFGSCAYATAIQRGMGLSRIVATGNEADIDVAECIEWFARDKATRVICAAIEACRDGDRLRHALRAAALAGKPVIIMKVGSTDIGRAAAATHTGSLAGNDAFYDTVFRECGAYRAHSIAQMLDIASLCVYNALASNQRAGIVTLSGGIGILMADAAEPAALELPEMPAAAAARMSGLAPFASIGNPMDTTAQISAVPDGLASALRIVLEETDWGTVFLYLAQKAAEPKAFAAFHEQLLDMRRDHPDRCLVLVGPSHVDVQRQLERDGISMITDPSSAVAAAGAAALLARRMSAQQALGSVPGTLCPARRAAADAAPVEFLSENESKRLLAAQGFPILSEKLARCAEEAVAAASAIGYPVAIKIVSADIQHKTEVGGVMLSIGDAAALSAATTEMLERVHRAQPDARIDGVLVAPMLSDGIETIVALQHDPVFGPMIMFGLGGIAVELFRDVVFASAPLSLEQARELVSRARSAALLGRWRGRDPVDQQALCDLLVRLSRLPDDMLCGIDSIEINPLLVQNKGVVCIDALVGRYRAATST